MPVPWNDDPAGWERHIEGHLNRLGNAVVAQAGLRAVPTIAMAQDWHRETYRGVPLPVPCYAGEIRDTDADFPELIGYEVAVGTAMGAPSSEVPDALTALEAGLQAIIARMDRAIAVGDRPGTSADLVAVLEVAAIAHGEWVRIHPFANGNGRIARLWANWVSVRYGLPFFLTLKPRPANVLYASAAAASMRGDHRPMVVTFLTLLDQHVAS